MTVLNNLMKLEIRICLNHSPIDPGYRATYSYYIVEIYKEPVKYVYWVVLRNKYCDDWKRRLNVHGEINYKMFRYFFLTARI